MYMKCLVISSVRKDLLFRKAAILTGFYGPTIEYRINFCSACLIFKLKVLRLQFTSFRTPPEHLNTDITF